MSRRNLLIVTLLAWMAGGGCVILPVPNARLEGWGIDGRVVDATSGGPIAGASVVDADRPGCRVTSDADGRFRLPPHVQWHFAFLFGAVSYPLLPFTGDLVSPSREAYVRAPGYGQVTVSVSDGRTNMPDVTLQGEWFRVPAIGLTRTAPTTTRASDVTK